MLADSYDKVKRRKYSWSQQVSARLRKDSFCLGRFTSRGGGWHRNSLFHHDCPHLTWRSKVLEKSTHLPKVTQQLMPEPAGTREGCLEKVSRVLRMEVHHGFLLPGFQASGSEFSRRSFKVLLRQLPLQSDSIMAGPGRMGWSGGWEEADVSCGSGP